MKKIEPIYRGLLEQVRNNTELVKDYCSLKVDTSDPLKDLNEKKRFDLSIALFNDLQESDELIIKYIFKEEFEALKTTKKTYPKAFELIAFLYTYNKSAEKVIDFYNLKILNYDTFCGFEREHLLTGGIKETLRFLESIDKETATKIKQEICHPDGNPYFDDSQIQNWWEYKKSEFNIFKYPENLNEEIDFHIAIKDSLSLKNLIIEWESQVKEWDKKHLGKLNSILNIIGSAKFTISILEQKIEMFEGEIINLALTKQYLEALIGDKEYDTAIETIKKKLESKTNRILQTSLFFHLLNISEQSNTEGSAAEALKILKENSGKLNQQLINRLQKRGNDM